MTFPKGKAAGAERAAGGIIIWNHVSVAQLTTLAAAKYQLRYKTSGKECELYCDTCREQTALQVYLNDDCGRSTHAE